MNIFLVLRDCCSRHPMHKEGIAYDVGVYYPTLHKDGWILEANGVTFEYTTAEVFFTDGTIYTLPSGRICYENNVVASLVREQQQSRNQMEQIVRGHKI